VSNRSQWLDDKPAPDVQTLDQRELFDTWVANRNNLLGPVAADEIAKRAFTTFKAQETKK
jgi:hypothetical protein